MHRQQFTQRQKAREAANNIPAASPLPALDRDATKQHGQKASHLRRRVHEQQRHTQQTASAQDAQPSYDLLYRQTDRQTYRQTDERKSESETAKTDTRTKTAADKTHTCNQPIQPHVVMSRFHKQLSGQQLFQELVCGVNLTTITRTAQAVRIRQHTAHGSHTSHQSKQQ